MLTHTKTLSLYSLLSNSDQDEQFHYVLSSTQEEEIRECFLIDKFRNYSMVRACLENIVDGVF